MKIRLMGTRDEVTAAVDAIRTVLDVQEVSAPYANRGSSRLVRVYVEVGGVLPSSMPATVERVTTSRERTPVDDAVDYIDLDRLDIAGGEVQ